MTELIDAVASDRALKAKHRAMWAMGDYPAVASELIPSLGPTLVDAAGVVAGERVLDVAAGSGNVAIPAARAGAQVTATDLTPELLEAGRRNAEREELAIEWREADAEALPFDDGSFDVVLSCVGVMFAPHHKAAASELLRVTRSGGRIGLLSWTPSGFIGEMFATMKPYAPPPPAGAQPPPLWGSEAHVRELLGDGVTDVETKVQALTVDLFGAPADFREYFKRTYGPTIAVYRFIADDAQKVASLDADLDALARRYGIGEGSGSMAWEYLLLTARRS